jgi:hypothetical protein
MYILIFQRQQLGTEKTSNLTAKQCNKNTKIENQTTYTQTIITNTTQHITE